VASDAARQSIVAVMAQRRCVAAPTYGGAGEGAARSHELRLTAGMVLHLCMRKNRG
jgi:hypothetical protein